MGAPLTPVTVNAGSCCPTFRPSDRFSSGADAGEGPGETELATPGLAIPVADVTEGFGVTDARVGSVGVLGRASDVVVALTDNVLGVDDPYEPQPARLIQTAPTALVLRNRRRELKTAKNYLQ